MTSKKKKEIVEEVVEVVVKEEPIVEDVPRSWYVKVWKLNEPHAKDVMVGVVMYSESTDELAIQGMLFPQYRHDIEILLLEAFTITQSDGTRIMVSPDHDKLHFIKNLHLGGTFFKTFYVDEAGFSYEVE